MTLDEAVNWCRYHNARIKFKTNEEGSLVQLNINEFEYFFEAISLDQVCQRAENALMEERRTAV